MASSNGQMDPLLAPKSDNNKYFQGYGAAATTTTTTTTTAGDDSVGPDDDLEGMPTPMVRGWSFQEGRRSTATTPHKPASSPTRHHHSSPPVNRTIPIGVGGREAAAASAKEKQSPNPGCTTSSNTNNTAKKEEQGYQRFLYYMVYAFVNVIISAPGLYGYTAVIFNHPIFQPHMNALSKLVIFSSLIHQLGFLLFSSLDFAIGTVQDAGLIFLSSMAHTIAKQMLSDGHSEEEILSTTCVLLSLGTAALGGVLVLMGKFRLADAVSYLPMPVIGGYLAFIGYFCCQAGIALCISTPLVTLSDWQYVIATRQTMILVAPGLIAGLILTLTSRWATNASVLPLTMVAIPAFFYVGMYGLGMTMQDARDEGWIGAVAPPVPIGDLFRLIDFQLVRWDMITRLFGTWIGMVFVVSFASCLDVAAISLDMGEALDTNRELATVGICNVMSGLSFGFTGSYIFSQTIFTYRTGVHTKWIGVLIMLVFMYIVASPVNILQISPLFFLGSTLIFIGYDLMYEWLWEIRHQVFLSEYGIVWLTFCAIQVVGINDGILLGVLIAILEQVVLNAQTSNIHRVQRNSRAIWTPSDAKILHDHAYNPVWPKIITIEVIGTVFFGSSLHLLNRIIEEIGLDEDEKVLGSPTMGPHTPSFILTHNHKPIKSPQIQKAKKGLPRPLGMRRRPPKYLVLDLMHVSNLDASATRGCFLQLVKMCAKRGIIICASGLSPRMEWMFRSHGVSHKKVDDEEQFKAHLLSRNRKSPRGGRTKAVPVEVSLLFVTVQEALEFCETALIKDLNMSQRSLSASQIDPAARSLPNILAHMLGASTEIKECLDRLEDARYHEERDLKSGDLVFQIKSHSDAFYVVLQGCIANSTHTSYASNRQQESVFSGAGLVHSSGRLNSTDNLFDAAVLDQQGQDVVSSVATLWRVGGIFGYLDFLLERPRTFRAVATQDGTRLARVTQSHLNLMQSEDPVLYGVIQRVLLHASTLDLRNCTCGDV